MAAHGGGPVRGRPARPSVLRPRYGRITTLTSSLLVTVVAVLGATGAIPTSSPDSAVSADSTVDAEDALTLSAVVGPATRQFEKEPGAAQGTGDGNGANEVLGRQRRAEQLPPKSGSGKRVVFDMSDQRVWLVDRGDQVRRTYLVSGSVTDNLRPGTYEVYSTSRHAVGVDDSGTMQFMVRFAHGRRAAIGFHDIPVKDAEPVQTRAELGTPRSHGCIRQARPDARALWDFAPVGTTVVVTD